MSWIGVVDGFCDWTLRVVGVYHMPNPENSEEHPKREDRAPYPPDDSREVLPPADGKPVNLKRQAADKEFWESM